MTTGRRPTLTPDELADTDDEILTSARRVTGPHPRLSAGEVDGLPADTDPLVPRMHREIDPADFRAHDFDKWEALQKLRDDNAALRARVEQVERRNAILWRVIGGVAGVAVTAAGIAIKLVYSSGENAGAAREREVARLADHARLDVLAAGIDANARAIAEIRGVLWTINPVGAVRLQGPARIPPPSDPVTP